jgi:hypothetical protein
VLEKNVDINDRIHRVGRQNQWSKMQSCWEGKSTIKTQVISFFFPNNDRMLFSTTNTRSSP